MLDSWRSEHYVRGEYCLSPIYHVIGGYTSVLTRLCSEAPHHSWQFFHPPSRCFVIFLVQPLFKGVYNHAVGSLDLAIGSGMSYRHVLYDYASVITEVPECIAGELSNKSVIMLLGTPN